MPPSTLPALLLVLLGPTTALGAEPPPASEPLIAFASETGRYGYADASGTIVIPARYRMAYDFVEAVAPVLTDEGWWFIDRSGASLARPFLFDNGPDPFVEGRARIVEGDRYGFIASSGEILVAPTWSWVEPFSGDRAAVCRGCQRTSHGEHFTMGGGAWGQVDRAGAVVVAPPDE